MFRFFKKSHTSSQEGPRTYKQMAVSPEAHARIIARAEKRGDTIIDTFDKLMGVK